MPQSRLREGEEDGGGKVGRAGEWGPREGGVAAEDGGGRATNGGGRWGEWVKMWGPERVGKEGTPRGRVEQLSPTLSMVGLVGGEGGTR